MKNREYKTLVAIVLAMTMVAGTLAAPATVYAKEDAVKTEASADKADKKSSSAKTLKDETVYAKIDGNGSVTSVTVSDQLKNVTDKSEIKDVSTLENIENVKGDEEFSQKSNALTWNGDSKDICYQGTTSQALPVGVKITYTLDGKTIGADELQGKSGHLVMQYQYENTTGGSGKEYTPFLMVTGLILDTDKFTNVKVTNGKLVSDGDRDMVLGMGLPEMKTNLGVDDLDIPDYFEMEADVTDYETVEGITIATNDVFNELETDKLDDLSDLKNSMNKLQDSANQLVDGSGQLKDGLDTLLSSSGTLKDGIGQLADGSKTLKNGTGTLLDGSNALADGSWTLADGTRQLADGTGVLSAGTQELNAGLGLVSGKVSNELLPGAKALDDGVLEMQKSLGAQLPVLCQGVAALNSGIAQAGDGAAALDAGIQQVADGAAGLNSGIQQVAAGVTDLKNGMTVVSGKADELGNAATKLSNLFSNVTPTTYNYSEDTTSSYDEIDSLTSIKNALADSIANSEEPSEADLAAVSALDEVIYSLQAEQQQREDLNAQNSIAAATAETSATPADAAKELADAAYALSAAVKGTETTPGLSAAVGQLDAALNTGDPDHGIPALASASQAISSALNDGDASTNTASIRSGAQALDAALNTGDPANNVSSIRAGISTLNKGVNGENGLSTQVNAGVSKLKAGTSQLLGGISGDDGLANGLNQLSAGASQVNSGAATLNEKMAEANEGAKSVSAGASQLSAGAGELNSGAGTLADGIQTLNAGSDALIDGVKQLDDGAKTLNEGMIQFNEEGIQKLVSAFDGDIEGMLDKLNNMMDASKKYKNFSGISDGMDGEVKFIFVTNK